jgi:hypothetical protein
MERMLNTSCGQNAELLLVKDSDVHSYDWASEG